MERTASEEVLRFIELLTNLSGQLGEIFRTGNIAAISDMNKTIKEMYRLQHGSGDSALQAVEEDCQVIYGNFDMMIAVLRTTENGVIDEGAQKALGKFLHNINEAAVNIAVTYGLVSN